MLTQTPIPVHDQVIGWSTLARTVAALGDSARYADAEARVLELAPHFPLHAAAAFVNLAFGARALRDWELAAEYANRGISVAAAQGNRLVALVGRALLRDIEAFDPGPPPAAPLHGREAQALRELAADKKADGEKWYWGKCHETLINNFYSSLCGAEREYPPLEEGLKTAETVFEIYKENE